MCTIKIVSMHLLLVILLMGFCFGVNEAQLSYNYYKKSCPNVEYIVRKEMLKILLTDATSPAAFLRLLFHDCQVQGCDASILLDFSGANTKPEIISSRNFGIRNRAMIQHIKSILEIECPGQVSCADIIALSARESVSLTGGPHINIPLGRKDSRISSNLQADAHLPPPTISVHNLLQIFMSKGMRTEESVAILGAHTLGVGHCTNIVGRLYHPDPADRLNFVYRSQLRFSCPNTVPLTNLTQIPNDLTPMIFDNQYYKELLHGKGLFRIDSWLWQDPRTAPIVGRFAMDQNYFFEVFASAFVKLSSANVLGSRKGEVRKHCNHVN